MVAVGGRVPEFRSEQATIIPVFEDEELARVYNRIRARGTWVSLVKIRREVGVPAMKLSRHVAVLRQRGLVRVRLPDDAVIGTPYALSRVLGRLVRASDG